MLKAVRVYQEACQKGTAGAILWSYGILWRYFHKPEAYPGLCKDYEAWTGYPVHPAPKQIVVVGAQALLPWTVALCKAPPWPPEMPSHAIPVSVVELAYLGLAPVAHRPALIAQIVKLWEQTHLTPEVNRALGWFRDGTWEVVEIKKGTESVWQHPETSKPSLQTKSHGMPISRKRVPKGRADQGVDSPDE